MPRHGRAVQLKATDPHGSSKTARVKIQRVCFFGVGTARVKIQDFYNASKWTTAAALNTDVVAAAAVPVYMFAPSGPPKSYGSATVTGRAYLRPGPLSFCRVHECV